MATLFPEVSTLMPAALTDPRALNWRVSIRDSPSEASTATHLSSESATFTVENYCNEKGKKIIFTTHTQKQNFLYSLTASISLGCVY